MRFLRVGEPGAERPIVSDDTDTTFDLSPLTRDVDGHFLAGDGFERTRQALDGGELEPVDLTGMRSLPPPCRRAGRPVAGGVGCGEQPRWARRCLSLAAWCCGRDRHGPHR